MAAEHLALLAALGICIAELGLYGFHKIPFTCSYLPGKVAFQYGDRLPLPISDNHHLEVWAELEMRALSEAAMPPFSWG